MSASTMRVDQKVSDVVISNTVSNAFPIQFKCTATTEGKGVVLATVLMEDVKTFLLLTESATALFATSSHHQKQQEQHHDRRHPHPAQPFNNVNVQMMKTEDGHEVANGLDRGRVDVVIDEVLQQLPTMPIKVSSTCNQNVTSWQSRNNKHTQYWV